MKPIMVLVFAVLVDRLLSGLCAMAGLDLAIAPIIIGAGIAGAASLGSALINKSGNKKVEQQPLETPEQSAARAKLLEFANSGKFGDFTAGEQVPLGYGDYTQTGLEAQGQTALQNLLNGGIPDQYRLGDQALAGFLQTDPNAIQAQFDPFKAQVERQIAESNRNLTRGAGFAGNLYSTDTIRGLGDIQARGNETLTAQLANLTNEQANRRLQAVPLAYQSAEAQQGARLQQIAASQSYGALQRQLNDASIKARDAELLRRRQELQLPIEALKSVAGGAPSFGVQSIQSPSPYQDLLGLVGQLGGQYLGNELTMGQYKRNFPGAVPQVPGTIRAGGQPALTPSGNQIPYS